MTFSLKHPAGIVGALAVLVAAGCGGGGGGGTAATTPVTIATAAPTVAATAGPTASPTIAAAGLPAMPLAINVSNLSGQFYGEIVAQLSHISPRQMVMLPNGDLLVGTGGGMANFAQSGQVYLIPNAEAAVPAAPVVFTTLADTGCTSSTGTNTNGVAFAPGSGGGTIFVGLECSIWKIPYVTGDHTASSAPVKFASIRTGGPPAGADPDVHHTTSLLAVGSTLYAGIGSSCNACTETDTTRAVVLKTGIASASFTTVATRLRNALALAVNPATGTVWAGGAGQDCEVGATCFQAQDATYALNGHPYEWLDPLTKHATPVDYMWPWCEENGAAVTAAGTPPAGTNCAAMIVAPVRAPAYSTIMSAVFYAPPAGATYAFPSAYQGGMFATLHGSWHEDQNGIPVAVPEVIFVPITASDAPLYPMDWTGTASPYATWARNASGNPAPFMNGFQSQGTRIGRPTGIAVGTSGSLFISDDSTGVIYRIRPGTAPAARARSAAPASVRSLR